MQIDINPDEQLTIKEYQKRKKKQIRKNNFSSRSKLKYILFGILLILVIYICIQYYFYHKSNNYKYIEDELVKSQNVYATYYVTEGYTYDPVYSLNRVNSDGFDEKSVIQNGGLTNILVDDNNIYGIKLSGIVRTDKNGANLEQLIDKDILKYTLYKDRIYFICQSNNELKYIDLKTKEVKGLGITNVSEVIVDDNNIYVAIDEKTKKILVKFDKEGQNKVILSSDVNVSYIIQDMDRIYFVNKKDSNKIYQIGKDGTGLGKVEDISSVSDNGNIKEIDGSKYMFVRNNYLFFVNSGDNNFLWSIDLQTKEKKLVLPSNVEILQNVNNTIFYKLKYEMGVYLYNYETQFMSQVTKRKIKEFYVDTTDIVQSKKNANEFRRN